jgi:hypothetical protein
MSNKLPNKLIRGHLAARFQEGDIEGQILVFGGHNLNELVLHKAIIHVESIVNGVSFKKNDIFLEGLES